MHCTVQLQLLNIHAHRIASQSSATHRSLRAMSKALKGTPNSCNSKRTANRRQQQQHPLTFQLVAKIPGGQRAICICAEFEYLRVHPFCPSVRRQLLYILYSTDKTCCRLELLNASRTNGHINVLTALCKLYKLKNTYGYTSQNDQFA